MPPAFANLLRQIRAIDEIGPRARPPGSGKIRQARGQTKWALIEHDRPAMIIESGHLFPVMRNHLHALEPAVGLAGTAPDQIGVGARFGQKQRRILMHDDDSLAPELRQQTDACSPSPSSGDRANRLTPMFEKLSAGQAIQDVNRPVRRQIQPARSVPPMDRDSRKLHAERLAASQLVPARGAQGARSSAESRSLPTCASTAGNARRMRSLPSRSPSRCDFRRENATVIAGDVDDDSSMSSSLRRLEASRKPTRSTLSDQRKAFAWAPGSGACRPLFTRAWRHATGSGHSSGRSPLSDSDPANLVQLRYGDKETSGLRQVSVRASCPYRPV